MSISSIARHTQKLVTDNSPTILTALGVTGVVTTAYLAGTASFKAGLLLAEEEQEQNEANKRRALAAGQSRSVIVLHPREKIALVWKLYIPAVGTGILTIASIIGANHIGMRRAAAMASVVKISELAFTEYKEKVIDKIGENKEKAIRDEIAQDRVNRTESKIIVSTDSGLVMCHDAFSNQYFMSDMETLRRAENDVNAQILHSDYATLSDFYQYVNAQDLETTSVSSDIGWNTDKMMHLDFSTVMYKDRTPCISINFATIPIRDPWRFC